MKKLVSLVFSIVLGVCSCLVFNACGSKDREKSSYKYNAVSSLEQLYSMRSDEAYKLTCDIDFEGREWVPLSVAGFNGQGHTISNCVIQVNESSSWNGFFKTCRWLENITFDNCSITGYIDTGEYVAYVSIGSSRSETLENVTVKNCTIDIDYVSGSVYVGLVAGTISYGGEVEDLGTITVTSFVKNCHAENCSITSTNAVAVGGIVAEVSYQIPGDITDCSVTNLTVDVNSAHIVGGIVGRTRSGKSKIISHCSVADSSFRYGTMVGGIVGRRVAYDTVGCKVENNIFYSRSVGTLGNGVSDGDGMGGIVGCAENGYGESSVSNCLSTDNSFNYTGTGSDTKYIGGLFGAAKEYAQITVRSSLSINNKFSVESSKFICCDTVGWIKEGNAIFCGSYGNVFSGDESLHFMANVANSGVMYCYSDYENNITEMLESEKWIVKSELSVFHLDETIWTLTDGKLPSIVF